MGGLPGWGWDRPRLPGGARPKRTEAARQHGLRFGGVERPSSLAPRRGGPSCHHRQPQCKRAEGFWGRGSWLETHFFWAYSNSVYYLGLTWGEGIIEWTGTKGP